MKKIFLFFLLFIFTYIMNFFNINAEEIEKGNINVNGEKYNVVYENNYVRIQLNPSNSQNFDIYDYLKDFKVKLVGKNKVIEATNYDYNTFEGQIFITNKYKVKKNYPINVDFYEIAYTKVFNLVIEVDDYIKPNIILNKEIIQDVETSKIDESVLKTYFELTDNYYKKDQLTLEFLNYKQVNTKTVGTYKLEVKVSDLSNNFIIKSFDYKVVDVTAPNLKLLKPLEIYINEEFNFENFFEIKDNTDTNPRHEIKLDKVNNKLIGNYIINIKVIDKYNNISNYDYSLKVLERGLSKINLRKQFLDILVFETNFESIIKENVSSIEDEYYIFNLNDITIDSSYVDFNKVGKYKLSYYLYKENRLRAKHQIDVNIIDNIAPQIIKKKDLIIPFKSNFNLYNYFDFEDNYTAKEKLSIKFEPKAIDTSILQTFNLIITVKDESDNATQKNYDFIIKDINPPTITNLKNVYILEVNTEFNLDVFDVLDETVVSKYLVIDNNSFYKKLGTYNAQIKVTDLYDNTNIKDIVIKVVDETDPTLIIKQDFIKQEINEEEIDLKTYILEVSDNYDDLKIDDVIIKHNIDYTKTGKYEASFILKDKQDNVTIVKKDVFIDDYTKPIVREIKVLVLENDFSIDKLKEGLEIFDNSNDYLIDTNIESIKLVNTTNANLIYYVSDKKGNLTIFERNIKIIQNKKISLKLSLLIFSIFYTLISILAFLIINYIKYKNFSFVKNILKLFKK